VITTFGIFLTEVGKYDTAISILEEGLKLIDYDPEIWNYLGVAHWKKGKLDKALEAFKKCLSLDKNYPIAFNNMGSVYLSKFLKTKERDVFQQALYHFKKAIELDPNYASAYNGLGAAYMQTGNIEGAIYCWEKAVQFDSGLSFALYNLGIAYLQKGEKQKALDALSKYKEINYSSLPPGEKAKLDDLIRKCRRTP
jgi:superkiller protein 3